MSGQASRLGRAFCLPLVLLAALSALSSPPARAQSPTDVPPQIVYQNLHDGDVIQQPAFGIQFCFASPVNVKELGNGGDFSFLITEPDGIGLGSRDVFQPDGYGVTVYPGPPIGDPVGEWTYHYRVTSPDGRSVLEGDINYTVDPDGDPVSQQAPSVCVESGGTATATPGASESPASGAGTNAGEDGDSSNFLSYVLIAIGAFGIGLGALILFFFGRRRGRRPVPRPTAPMASRADTRGTSSPAADSGPPLPDWSGPLSSAPPVVQSEPSMPEPSPPPTPATPPVVQSETPLPESTPLETPVTSAAAQSETRLPEPSSPPVSARPAADERAGESADNSRFALIAIAAAVILVLGVILRGRGKRGGDNGKRG